MAGETSRRSARRPGRGLGFGHVAQQQRELVAAESGDGVATAHTRPQSLGDDHQDLVADGVAEAVVDRLEVVEIDEEQGDSVVRALGPLNPLFHAIAKEHAIGQIGQRIVERLMRKLVLEALAVADVAGGQDQPAHIDVVEQIAGHGLDVLPGAIVMSRSIVDRGRDARDGSAASVRYARTCGASWGCSRSRSRIPRCSVGEYARMRSIDGLW